MIKMLSKAAGRDKRAPAPSQAGEGDLSVPKTADQSAQFGIGEVVRHKLFPFRGVIFDVDPQFNNTDEWWEAIPEPIRPAKDQPFYHLLAENEDSSYVAYVSQQNLVRDEDGDPVQHPAAAQLFETYEGGRYRLRPQYRH